MRFDWGMDLGAAVTDRERDFCDFVLAASPALLRTAWMLTGDSILAEDLLQTALAKAWPRWNRLSSEGNPVAYVRKTMANTQISWWRRRWNGEIPSQQVPDRGNPTDPFAAVDDREALRRALRALPQRQRAVVVLRYYEDCSEEETAAALGCSIGTVKSQAAKGLARLRVAVNECDRPSPRAASRSGVS